MKTESKSKQLLKSLLAPLIQEWGYEKVYQSLAEWSPELLDNISPSIQSGKHTKDGRRPNALDIFNRLVGDVSSPNHVRELAIRFDEKTFLPTVSDVRNFLELRGENAHELKNRQESFRKILELLLRMPENEVQVLRDSEIYAGPTKLGPLSDAIKESSSAIRNVGNQVNAAEEVVSASIKEDDASDKATNSPSSQDIKKAD